MKMSYDEFVDLVVAMRLHQKEYFRLRDRYNLMESKRLEKEVDSAIVDYLRARMF